MSIRLRKFEGRFGLKVIRDGLFEGTGKLSTQHPGRLVVVRSAQYVEEANEAMNVSAVLTLPGLEAGIDERLAVAVSDYPNEAHSAIHMECAAARERQLRATPTYLHPNADVHERAVISSYGVTVGKHSVIGPNCVLNAGVVVEEDCRVQANCALGGAAFNLGVVGGCRRVLPSIGGVRIKKGSYLAANVCIDAAMFSGETLIGDETAIDHHAYIAHDVQLGKRVTVCGHAAVMGRVIIGDEAYVGPGAVIVNGAEIGTGAKISMGAIVTRDVPEGVTVSGNFALPHARFLDNLRRDR